MRFEDMISNDPDMLNIFDTIDRMTDLDCPVLIQGSTGTGKSLAAQAIHNRSLRSDRPTP